MRNIVLVALSVCLAPIVVYAYMSSRTTPLEFPVNLQPGTVRSTAFSVPMSATYDIRLAVDTPLPDELRCYINRVSAEDCKTDPLGLSWKFVREEQTVALGSSSTEKAVVGTARVLGRADLESGTTYVAEVTSHLDASRLSPLHPRIEVVMAPGAVDQYLQWPSVAAIAGAFLLVAGAAGAVISFWSRPRRHLQAGTDMR